MAVSLDKRYFNAYVMPYRHAYPGDESVAATVNLDEAFEAKEFMQGTGPKVQHAMMDSADGDPNGIMLEWYGTLQMWTVYYFNSKAPYLRRYQVRYSPDRFEYQVVDTESNDERVGGAPFATTARAIARNLNKTV